jgi:hypothetical protein
LVSFCWQYDHPSQPEQAGFMALDGIQEKIDKTQAGAGSFWE